MKIMFEKFFPDEYLGSTYKIPFEKLYEQGYRGVIFDIDNMEVPYGVTVNYIEGGKLTSEQISKAVSQVNQ